MSTDLSFGSWLKRNRRGLGLTQVELGQRIGYSGETIRKVEADEFRPSRQMAEALAVVFDVAPADRDRFLRFARSGGADGFVPLPPIGVPSPAPPFRHNLPLPPTPLIGRDAEVAAVAALLVRRGARLVTLTGAGGTGKTRLAVAAATAALDDFPHGVFFVDLAPIRDPSLVVSTIGRTLDVRETAGRPYLQALEDYLREKSLLLLLDNFEQVLDAGSTLADLLATSPHIKLLVTSREVLRLRAEHVFPVEPLAVPPLRDLPPLEALAAYPAVALFAERASDARPDFRVTDENAAAVAEICARLDGLPLAIELAAARVRLLPPAALLSRLGKGFALVAGGARDLPARQQTLQATIEWSYDLLAEDEKTLFRRFAVFAGGATLEAIEAVCNADGDLGSDGTEGVAALVDKSLLRQTNDQGEPRLGMLETIRDYASDRLAEAGGVEVERVRTRHLEYFVALAEQATPKLWGPDQLVWMDRLDAEQDNLRAAVEWAAHSGKVELGLRIGGALREFFKVRGPSQAWRDRVAELVKRSRNASRGVAPTVLARAYLTLTDLTFWLEDHAVAQAWARETIALATELGTDGRQITAWVLAVMAHAEPDPPERRRLAEEALALVRDGSSVEERTIVGLAQIAVGQAFQYQQDYAAARPWFEAAMARFQELDNPLSRAYTAGYFGLMLMYQGKYAQADVYVEEALAFARRTGNKLDIARNVVRLGHILVIEGRVAEGEALLREGFAIDREVGNLPRAVEGMNNLGELARRRGDYTCALALNEQALALAHESGDPVMIGHALEYLARTMLDLGRPTDARPLLSQSLPLIHHASYPGCITHSLEAFALLALAEDRRDRASRLYGAVEALIETVDIALPVFEYAEHPRVMAAARADLYGTAWDEGRAMTMDEAVAYALEEAGPEG
ncbi:MAG: helix-turn-helix domain-containing protein [Anaerolineae bacterium]